MTSLNKFTHSGNVLLAGFGGMLIMMSVLVYLAVKQDIPMVSKNYYQQELVYQHKLDAMNNANIHGNDFSIEQDADQLRLRIPSSLSKNISEGSVYFYCPSLEKMDRKEGLYASEDGAYLLQAALMPGVKYIVKVSFRSGGKDYYKELILQ
jgi:nitrogen fixation protein FixH